MTESDVTRLAHHASAQLTPVERLRLEQEAERFAKRYATRAEK